MPKHKTLMGKVLKSCLFASAGKHSALERNTSSCQKLLVLLALSFLARALRTCLHGYICSSASPLFFFLSLFTFQE